MAVYSDRQAAFAAINEYMEDITGLYDSCWNGPVIVAEIKDIISELPSPWVSVEDRLPECDGNYICLSRFKLFDGTLDKNVRTYLRYYSAAGQCFEGQRLSLITHWMPRPDAPEVAE